MLNLHGQIRIGWIISINVATIPSFELMLLHSTELVSLPLINSILPCNGSIAID